MLSVASAAPSSFVDSCTGHGGPFLDLEFTSWDLHDLIFEHELEYEPKPITSILMSSQSNQNVFNSIETNQTSPGSTESNHSSVYSIRPVNDPVGLVDRKLKRMRSNRESAHRSRMKKQQRLDDLKNQSNWLSITNQELSIRLRFMLYNGLIVRSENQRLQTEHTLLRHKMIEFQNLMIFHRI